MPSRKCLSSADLPAVSSAHGGESAGHRRTVLWSVEALASRYTAASGSSVPAAKKSFKLLGSLMLSTLLAKSQISI